MDKLTKHAEVSARGQDGSLFRNKKQLRDALKDAPGFVEWLVVGTPVSGLRDWYLTTAQLVEAITDSASLTGPDPATDRRYYGTVTVKNGKLVVK